MINEDDYRRLRDKVYQLDAKVAFLYQHLGLTFNPDTSLDDARIVEKLKNNDLLGAIKVHRELFKSDLEHAREAVLEIKGRLEL